VFPSTPSPCVRVWIQPTSIPCVWRPSTLTRLPTFCGIVPIPPVHMTLLLYFQSRGSAICYPNPRHIFRDTPKCRILFSTVLFAPVKPWILPGALATRSPFFRFPPHAVVFLALAGELHCEQPPRGSQISFVCSGNSPFLAPPHFCYRGPYFQQPDFCFGTF